MSERDPRVDPKPGDVLRSFLGLDVQVSSVMSGGSHISYVLPDEFGDLPRVNTIAEWRIWARNAEVIHRAE